MTGIEYAVLGSTAPRLFLIAKQERIGPEKGTSAIVFSPPTP